MMKKICFLVVLLLAGICGFGQTNYEPQILVICPAQTNYDPVFEKQIAAQNLAIKSASTYNKDMKAMQSKEFKRQPANLQTMAMNEAEFRRNSNFFKNISDLIGNYLAYRFMEKFPNLLVTIQDVTSDGSVASLGQIAAGKHLQYVINIPLVELRKEGNDTLMRMKLQLYDNMSGTVVLDKTYTGDNRNPGFEFTCNDRTIECTVNNAIAAAMPNVIATISQNSPTLKREREVARQRSDALFTTYYPKPFDDAYVKSIIDLKDTLVDVKDLYQCIYNDDKTKFVAFFVKDGGANDLRSLSQKKGDMNVKVLTSKDIKDKDYLDKMPQIYGYIVDGVKYKNKWYYEKTNVTYFEADNLENGKQQYFNILQTLNFFKNNSADFNSEFWETSLFEKIPDLTKDPDWPKYGKGMWESEEKENRPYIGMYKIVADKMREGSAGPVVKRVSIN